MDYGYMGFIALSMRCFSHIFMCVYKNTDTIHQDTSESHCYEPVSLLWCKKSKSVHKKVLKAKPPKVFKIFCTKRNWCPNSVFHELFEVPSFMLHFTK